MHSRMPAMALFGVFAVAGWAQAPPAPLMNRPIFEISLSWKKPKGETVTCPIDDVSYIDLVAPNPAVSTTPGTLTFIMDEGDHGWWWQSSAAIQSKAKVDLTLTIKFLKGGKAMPPIYSLAVTPQTPDPSLETASTQVIKLSGVTAITAQDNGQGAFAREGDRDSPKVYTVAFGSIQILPAP